MDFDPLLRVIDCNAPIGLVGIEVEMSESHGTQRKGKDPEEEPSKSSTGGGGMGHRPPPQPSHPGPSRFYVSPPQQMQFPPFPLQTQPQYHDVHGITGRSPPMQPSFGGPFHHRPLVPRILGAPVDPRGRTQQVTPESHQPMLPPEFMSPPSGVRRRAGRSPVAATISSSKRPRQFGESLKS